MSLVIASSSASSFCYIQSKISYLYFRETTRGLYNLFFHGKIQWCCMKNNYNHFNEQHMKTRWKGSAYQSFTEESTMAIDWEDVEQEEIEDKGSPWEGAIIYKRNPSISHIEYCTTLERLGLGRLSTDVSKSRASLMGLRVTKAVKDYPHGTPVQISVDVTKKKKKLRLDGILKSVITLACNRCGEPAAESIFSEFTLLLTEDPIEEPDTINIGINTGEEKSAISGNIEEDEEDYETSVDLDDWLYFPHEEKEIDISKHMRDLVHVEITINAVCDPRCKGLCLKCGTNLNTASCNCSTQEVTEKAFGPLGNLKEQMRRK